MRWFAGVGKMAKLSGTRLCLAWGQVIIYSWRRLSEINHTHTSSPILSSVIFLPLLAPFISSSSLVHVAIIYVSSQLSACQNRQRSSPWISCPFCTSLGGLGHPRNLRYWWRSQTCRSNSSTASFRFLAALRHHHFILNTAFVIVSFRTFLRSHNVQSVIQGIREKRLRV